MKLGISIFEIANKIKCHQVTVYRELKRNKSCNYYDLKYAHLSSINQRKAASKYRISTEHMVFIYLLLSIDERPLIVNGRERFGDWEINMMLSRHDNYANVTILERNSQFI